LTPTRIYVRAILDLLNRFEIKGISHITGGGFYENIPRMLPKGLSAVIHLGSFPVLPVFHLIERSGKIPTRDMYNTFNMGIGMVIAVSSEKADEVCRHLNKAGEQAYIIGVVTAGDGGITLC
jgi:phosphoribosylformylglycinamidine cyclo-ligase